MKIILTAERVDLVANDVPISAQCYAFDCTCQGCVWDG